MTQQYSLKDILSISNNNSNKSKKPKIKYLSDNAVRLYVSSLYEPVISLPNSSSTHKVEPSEYIEIGTGYKLDKKLVDINKVTLLACPIVSTLMKYDIIFSSFYLTEEAYTEIRIRCKLTSKGYEDYLDYTELNIPSTNSSILELRLL